ncbi:hypothetical protein JCM3766R1_003580 [Sporobolomyces carnicolor]
MSSSSPLASDRPPPSPFSRLPPELVRQVIETSVPLRYRTATYDKRQSTLRSFCQVSRLFHAFAQPLLDSVTYIDAPERFDRWTYHDKDGKGDIRMQEFFVDCRGEIGWDRLQPVLELQANLRTLVLTVPPGDIDIADLEHFKLLDRLDFHFALVSAARPFVLPNVSNMTWHCVSFSDSSATLDEQGIQAAFPSLRAFAISPQGDASSDRPVVERLLRSSRLDAVSLYADQSTLNPLDATLLADIRHKILFDLEWWLTEYVPRQFVCCARFEYDHGQEVENLVTQLVDGSIYPSLKLLIIHPRLSKPIDDDEVSEMARQNLLKACRDRKIEVVFEDMPGLLDSRVSQYFWRRMREARKAGWS